MIFSTLKVPLTLSLQAKHPEDATGEHRDHPGQDGAGVSPGGGAIYGPVCEALVHSAEEHPGQ